MWRLIYFLPTYLLFLIFRTVMILLGLILIPPMAILHKLTTKSQWSTINNAGKEILVWKFSFMWPWSNEEDGVVAGEEFLSMPTWFRIIYWSAIRNPANNLRFVKGLSVELEPSKIRHVATTPVNILGHDYGFTDLYALDMDEYCFVYLCWQGIYSNFRVQFKMFGKIWRFWIGWKIYPHDSYGISPTDYRNRGAGFATQFKRVHPRG